MSTPPPTLDYAIPVSESSLPWWMVVAAAFFYLCCGLPLVCLAFAINAGSIVITLLLAIGVVALALCEWSAIKHPGSRICAVVVIFCAVTSGVSLSFLIVALLIRSKGPWVLPEVVVLAGLGSLSLASAFVAIAHVRWWARRPLLTLPAVGRSGGE